jgi:hypothetical protein
MMPKIKRKSIRTGKKKAKGKGKGKKKGKQPPKPARGTGFHFAMVKTNVPYQHACVTILSA